MKHKKKTEKKKQDMQIYIQSAAIFLPQVWSL